jgi:hypothetical protein
VSVQYPVLNELLAQHSRAPQMPMIAERCRQNATRVRTAGTLPAGPLARATAAGHAELRELAGDRLAVR